MHKSYACCSNDFYFQDGHIQYDEEVITKKIKDVEQSLASITNNTEVTRYH